MQLSAQIHVAIFLVVLALVFSVSPHIDAYLLQLVQQAPVEQAPGWLEFMLGAMFSIVPLIWLPRLSSKSAWFSMLAYGLIVFLMVLAILEITNIWIPPSLMITVVFLSYPLWRAIRIGISQGALDEALHQMRKELVAMGVEPGEKFESIAEADDQTRITKLMQAVQHMRDLHKSREDTLIFISHDVRTPIGAALMLLEKLDHNAAIDRIRILLSRAHVMAESFIQASRAETADVNKFKVVDIVSLIQQAIDDLHEMLLAKNILIETGFCDENIWVRADFGLLFRAVFNVLVNAIQYSPDNALIRVVVTHDGRLLDLRVIDQGPGIPEDKLHQLFKRFARVNAEHQIAAGSGLGLYFVNITVKKHRGTVEVKNRDGGGAEFIIRLPLERRKSDINVPYNRRLNHG